jgi:hypothetical protein
MRDIGDKYNHKELLVKKINHPNNSMIGALKNFTMFPDYMWAQLAVSWNCYDSSNRELNNTTYELAKLHFNYSEKKHNIISTSMDNNFEWHQKNIFNGLDSKSWEDQYILT